MKTKSMIQREYLLLVMIVIILSTAIKYPEALPTLLLIDVPLAGCIVISSEKRRRDRKKSWLEHINPETI